MILVTGGAGFIGSNFILDWLAAGSEPVINLDRLTYAGNLENLASVAADARYRFERLDICERDAVLASLRAHRPRAIVHFAAESHVDRSILGPGEFVRTNIEGSFALPRGCARLLAACRAANARPSASCMCRPTRSMARSDRTTRHSPRPPPISPTAPIRPRRRLPTIWYAPTTTPMACPS